VLAWFSLERGANDLYIVQLMPMPPHYASLHLNPDQFNLSRASWPKVVTEEAVVYWFVHNVFISHF